MSKECKEPKEKIINMVEIEVDLEEATIERLIKLASEEILKDRQALINYGVNLALKQIIETDGECFNVEDDEPAKI